MQTFQLVFYFTFSLTYHNDAVDYYEEITYGFIITDILGSKPENYDDGTYSEIIDELEDKYGVHDWSSRPSDLDTLEAIGFTTYEVKHDDINQLMQDWQTELSNKFPSGKVSKIHKLNIIDDEWDDLIIFKMISDLENANR